MTAIDPVTEHDCLANPDRLEVVDDDRPDVTVRKCLVCGRRHFEVMVDPGRVGVEVNG